ncbi:hypothetical protein K456DRAFT_1752279 [Colletotrichum gloeosporioides 23]|nr:hypothetical protein K456DRAFT_1752279 [Colletotrichum gloeosporioides 23]
MYAPIVYGLIFLILSAHAQLVAQPVDLKSVKGAAGTTVRFKQVPNGICETDANVKTFAGYVDVSPTQHIYFYLLEAKQNATSTPLTIRLDGGPGAPSMAGMFLELEPCSIDARGRVLDNPNSWSAISNLLQVFYQVMQGIMVAFPQYTANGIHITGQSYGGHYAPIFADQIMLQNQLGVPDTVNIPLRSISIEDGFMDSRVQFGAYFNYSVSPGNPYDITPFNDTLRQKLFNNMFGTGGCQEKQTACNSNPTDKVCADADEFCIKNVEGFWDVNNGRFENDIRLLSPAPYPARNFIAYLNRADIQAAIGASNDFTAASVQTSIAFSSTGDDSRTGVTVALFVGDADYDSNIIGAQMVAAEVGAANWASAGFVNLSANSDGQIPGQVKQADGFSFTRLYFAGHVAAFSQPEAARRIQERVIKGVDIATGTIPMVFGKNLITKGPPESLFKEGMATVQNKPLPKRTTYDPHTHLPILPARSTIQRITR